MAIFLIYILKSAFCLVVFYLCFKAFFSNDTFFRINRAILWIGSLACFLLPLVQLEMPAEKATFAQAPFVVLEEIFDTQALETENLIVESYNTTENDIIINDIPSPKAIPYTSILFGCFVVGMFVNLFLLLKSIYGIFRLKKIGEKRHFDSYYLIILSQDIQPFSWNKYIFISAKDYLENPNEILTHELAHIRHRHSCDVLFFELLTLLQWFNPAAWLLKKELKDLHEYQADTSVLKSGIDATKYQLLLVKKAVGSSSYTLANSFNHSKIKKRITMMLKEKSKKTAQLKLLLLLPAASLVLYAFARPEISRLEETLIENESTNNPPETENSIEEFSENSFQFPLKISKRVIGYGYRKNPATGENKLHPGMDIVGNGKDTIYAFTNGIVSVSEKRNDYGNLIIINHGDSLESLYAHNSQNLVNKDDRVYAGQAIGITGNTGRSTGDHLHFELRKNSKAIDPASLIKTNSITSERFEETLNANTEHPKIFVFANKENQSSLLFQFDDKCSKQDVQNAFKILDKSSLNESDISVIYVPNIKEAVLAEVKKEIQKLDVKNINFVAGSKITIENNGNYTINGASGKVVFNSNAINRTTELLDETETQQPLSVLVDSIQKTAAPDAKQSRITILFDKSHLLFDNESSKEDIQNAFKNIDKNGLNENNIYAILDLNIKEDILAELKKELRKLNAKDVLFLTENENGYTVGRMSNEVFFGSKAVQKYSEEYFRYDFDVYFNSLQKNGNENESEKMELLRKNSDVFFLKQNSLGDYMFEDKRVSKDRLQALLSKKLFSKKNEKPVVLVYQYDYEVENTQAYRETFYIIGKIFEENKSKNENVHICTLKKEY